MKIAKIAAMGLLLTPAVLPVRAETDSDKMSAAARLSQPGENHRRLDPLIGTWKVKRTLWPGPDASPVVSDDVTTTRSWILGGRYMRDETRGTIAGQDFVRIGIFGYNALDRRFEWTTFDAQNPGMMVYRSVQDDGSGTITLYGTYTAAGAGPEIEGRSTRIRVVLEPGDERRNALRQYVTPAGQDEFLAVKYVYSK